MSKKELNQIVDEPIVDEVTYAPDEVLAYLVKDGEEYFVEDLEGNRGTACMISKDDYIALTPNAANRKWYRHTKADAQFDNGVDKIPLYYKASKVFGPIGSRSTAMPNAKLIAYLSEEEQAEYKAIIDRAIAARDADKKKPMSEADKLRTKIEKAKAALAALEAEAAN